MNPFNSDLIPGPAGFCEAAGTGSVSAAPVPVWEAAQGVRRAAGAGQRVPGQEGMEAQERRCDPPAGPRQGRAGKEGYEKEENRCKFNWKNCK